MCVCVWILHHKGDMLGLGKVASGIVEKKIICKLDMIVEKRGILPVALCLVSGKHLLGLLERRFVCLEQISCWGQLLKRKLPAHWIDISK